MEKKDSRDERRDWRSAPPERPRAEQAGGEQGERRRQPRSDRETGGADSGPDYSSWYDKPSDWI